MSWTIPGGENRGTPLEQASEADLKFWIKRTEAGLAKDPNGMWAGKNQRWLAAAKAALAKRSGAKQSATQPTQAITPAQPDSVTAAIVCSALASAAAVTEALRAQAQVAHLVTPSTACGSLPEGCEVAISVVHVESDVDGGEVYPLMAGKLGLAKVALDKIGAAAGVTWDATLSGRLDNGRDPRYCHFRAVGYVRNFDGSIRTISGEKEMDLRDGSPQVEALEERVREKAARSKREGKTPSAQDASKQIREMRLHILGHAETKAKLRAIRSLGIKSSYASEELAKPFAVARLMWTGRSADPELRRAFALKQADAMIGATSMLYGGGPAEPRQLGTGAQTCTPTNGPRPHSAPPVGSIPEDDESLDTEWSYGDPDAGESDASAGQSSFGPPPQTDLNQLPPELDRGPDPDQY
jgi:hypothetical protein